MARFHINPETGTASVCKSTQGKCPFGAQNHYDTLPEAQKAAETRMAEEESTVPSAAKKPAPYSTVVPPVAYEYFTSSVTKGKDIKEHDRYLGSEVVAVKLGYKYASVTVKDHRDREQTHHLPLEEETTVDLRRETKASQAARKIAKTELALEEFTRKYSPRLGAASQAIQDRVASGHALQAYHLDDLVSAEASDSVVLRYKAMVKDCKADGQRNPYSRAEVAYKKELQDEVLMSSGRANSVSTSESSNLYDRAMLAAKANFLRHGPSAL